MCIRDRLFCIVIQKFGDQLVPAGHIQLSEDAVDMRLDSTDRDIQQLADFLIALSRENQLQNLALMLGQLVLPKKPSRYSGGRRLIRPGSRTWGYSTVGRTYLP